MLQCLTTKTPTTTLGSRCNLYLFVAIAPCTTLHWMSAVYFNWQLAKGPRAAFQGRMWAKKLSPLQLVMTQQRELVEDLGADLIGRLAFHILKTVKLRLLQKKASDVSPFDHPLLG